LALLAQLQLTPWQGGCILISAFLIGFSKTGINGVMMLTIPLLAALFGGKNSTGVILPMLMIGDVLAVIYYHRHVDWRDIARLLPWTLLGLGIGVWVGNIVNDHLFAILIAVSVLACLGALIFLERQGQAFRVPQSVTFWGTLGALTGFTTMVGNAAGPIFAVYLLARRFPKQQFLGITAWFFLVINLVKLPLQIVGWHNLSFRYALIGACALPAILAGAILGAWTVRKLPEKPFRYVVMAATFLAAVRLFF
jgi:hypothetical protein